MALHPQLTAIRQALESAGYGAGQWSQASVADLRAAARARYVPLGPAVPTRELLIPGAAGALLKLQLFTPLITPGSADGGVPTTTEASGSVGTADSVGTAQSADSPLPGLLFFGAGGYIVDELAGHTALCQQLAVSAGCAVMTVSPRLAPEHPFPAAILDAYAATCWVHENAEELGVDADRLAIGGESTGASVATAVCRLAKERRNPPLLFQLLLYPVVDLRDSSLAQLPTSDGELGLLLDKDSLAWAASLYAPSSAARDDARCSPLVARNLIGVPPALIISAEQDVLRGQIAAYAGALRDAYVQVTLSEYAGVPHGFVHLFSVLDPGQRALHECSEALRAALAQRSPSR